MVEKHRMCFQNTQQLSGQRYSHGVMMECYLALGQFEPAVRVYEAEVTRKELRGALRVALDVISLLASLHRRLS